MIRSGAINWGSPVNRSCGFNAGLGGLWFARPGIMGNTFYDLCGLNHLTLTNGPTFKAAIGPSPGLALELDGTDDYAIASVSPATNFPFTIACRFRTLSSSSGNAFSICQASGATRYADLQLNSSHQLNYQAAGVTNLVSITATNTVNDGAWHVGVGISRSATSHEFYLDGIQIGTSATNIGTITGMNTTLVGSLYFASSLTGYFPGQVSAAAVWPRDLSASEAWKLSSDWLTGFPLTLNRIERRWGYVAAASGGVMWNDALMGCENDMLMGAPS